LNNDNGSFPPATLRTLQILDLLAERPNGLTIKEISDELSIPIASLYRILNCMVSFGVVCQHKSQGDIYSLGYKIGIWASSGLAEYNLIEVSRPYMMELSEKTAQACQICILDENASVIICQELPSKGIAVISKLGVKIPINASAGGQAILSTKSDGEKKLFLDKAWIGVEKNTINTITKINDFNTKLINVAQDGYAIDNEEYAIGIGCIAVPIFVKGRAIASLGLTGSIGFYTKENINLSKGLLCSAADSISKDLLRS